MFLPDTVIKRTHPSDHKKVSLNINISSEHLSKNDSYSLTIIKICMELGLTRK